MSRRLTSWEFWPYWIFYLPVYGALPWFWLKSGSTTFFTAANQTMRHGGFVAYSKYQAVQGIPQKYLPKTTLLPDGVDATEVRETMRALGIDYPVVLKPDLGERGHNVEIIRDESELRTYLGQLADGLILQEYIDGPIEVGVMYARFPGESTGRITSVVHKDQMRVTGDGASTLKELILADPRGKKHQKWLFKAWQEELSWVPEPSESVRLNSVGNHARGSIFRDAGHLATDALTRVLDDIVSGLPGFHLGRFDILINEFDDLDRGDFRIIELNGANSEPGHIYDPENTLFHAYRDLLKHWNLMCNISTAAIRRGAEPDRFGELVASIRDHVVRKRDVKVTME